MENKKINCFKCKYYYVTWDKKFPRGCKFFNFKGKQMPLVTVKQSSGEPCKAFKAKDNT